MRLLTAFVGMIMTSKFLSTPLTLPMDSPWPSRQLLPTSPQCAAVRIAGPVGVLTPNPAVHPPPRASRIWAPPDHGEASFCRETGVIRGSTLIVVGTPTDGRAALRVVGEPTLSAAVGSSAFTIRPEPSGCALIPW
jgi:hypothetical protein